GVIASSSGSYAGGHYKADFDLEGNLYSINGYQLGRVDIDSFPLTGYEATLTSLNSVNTAVHDIAYNEEFDKFYTVNQIGHILVIDHKANTIEDLGDFSSSIGNPSAFGAVWCISSGELFFSQNTTGNIYRADLDANGNPTSVTLQLVGESTTNNDGSGCVRAESPFLDQDGDGIPNGNDDYPEDGVVAYATYTPDRISYGSYVFEDFWPKRGDYDFNDIVMGYNYEAARDTNNDTHWIIMNFKLRALGAGFKTGFGVQLDGITPEQVASVTGTTTTTISTDANGCESGQTQAVIMVTDNAHGNFGVPVGHFVNTGADGIADKDPVDITVKVTFTEPIADVGTINPFITTRGDRGYEIHLMGYAPTDLVNSSLFDTEGDVSGQGTTYVDAFGYPWGMHFPASFDYPKENVEIRTS
ncbi:MAG: LruC domain-containing protein, partial [Bacteroidota bacterium]